MKNKGFVLLETLIASTIILGALIFLYAQFSAIKRNFNTSFKYNTIPGLYKAKTLGDFLEQDGYTLYINELSTSDKGYLNINDCHNSRSSLCRKILNNISVKNVLFVSDNISILQNDLMINNYDKSIFNEDFKNFILTMNPIENQGRYQLILSYKDSTFAVIPIGVSNADERKMEYTVNHYLMNPDGKTYTLKDREELMWFNGYEVNPTVNSYAGFTSPEKINTILSRDNNEINYYYERNKYNVTVNYGEHIQSVNNIGLHYQGSLVQLVVNLDDGYKLNTITGDFTSLSFTMPTHDVNLNITAKISNETLSVTATGYSGRYDGSSHGITVTSSGATIKYGTASGTYNLTASPKYTDPGTYTVYYQVTKPGYKTVTGSKQVVIIQLTASDLEYRDGITVQQAIDDLHTKLK